MIDQNSGKGKPIDLSNNPSTIQMYLAVPFSLLDKNSCYYREESNCSFFINCLCFISVPKGNNDEAVHEQCYAVADHRDFLRNIHFIHRLSDPAAWRQPEHHSCIIAM
jgi:hypothetical protein